MSGTIYAKQGHTKTDGGERFTVEYRLKGATSKTVWWEVIADERLLPGQPSNSDLALTALLFLAMSDGVALHVEGKVSRSLLRNAERFMQIWALWRPDLYQQVQISADQEIEDRPFSSERDQNAICAFSGGVDAATTAWMHSAKLAGRANRNILAGVLIQGFDVGLEEHAAFAVTRTNCDAALNDIGVGLVELRTNWKESVCQNWEMEFGIGVFTCLKPWEDQAGHLLVGSCEDYSRLVVPWGSHPLPTTSLTSSDTNLVYDGGQFNRTQKVKILSSWPAGYDNLRVCWQGDVTGHNCGKCEKCLRTKLNAIVSGAPLPKSLEGTPHPAELKNIGPMNRAQLILFEEILDEARKNDFSGPLLDAVKQVVQKNRRRHYFKGTPLAKYAKPVLDKMPFIRKALFG